MQHSSSEYHLCTEEIDSQTSMKRLILGDYYSHQESEWVIESHHLFKLRIPSTYKMVSMKAEYGLKMQTDRTA